MNCSAGLVCNAKSAHITPSRSPLAISQQPDSVQNNSQLLPHSPVQLLHTRVASFLFSSLLSLLSLGYSAIPCCYGGQEDPLGEIIPIHWTCDLELPSSRCQCLSSLSSFKSELKTHLFSCAVLICGFLSSRSANPTPVMHVFVVCVCVCVCEREREREMKWAYPYTFVSTPGSYKMGHHK